MIDPALLWFDIETTGLKDTDHILAVGAILTTAALEQTWSKEWYIYTPQAVLTAMPNRVYKMHTKSGLLARCTNIYADVPAVDADTVFDEIMDVLATNTKRRCVYLAGNGIHFDRRFIRRDCPPLNDWLHYRMLDVSVLKIILDLYHPRPKEPYETAHMPLADLSRSMSLLKDNLLVLKNVEFSWLVGT